MRVKWLQQQGIGVRLMVYSFAPKAFYRIAQISDCHLLATAEGEYQQVNSAKHLRAIISKLLENTPDAVILTGDVTQDHSDASYEQLAQILKELNCPVFMLAGNHDCPDALKKLAQKWPFRDEKSLQLASWQLLLLNTKGETPAGAFSQDEAHWLSTQCQQSDAKSIWLFCHHHPLPLNSFIDLHGQHDAKRLWQTIEKDARIKGIAHGHAHHAYYKMAGKVQVVGCPASSVQFLQTDDWQTIDKGPMWCEWIFTQDGNVSFEFLNSATY